ncbi:MAG: VWA domain-containing protein [Pyrinomonadaceae bacterium]
MKKIYTSIFLAVFCLGLTALFAFVSFSTTNAQTTNRIPQTKTPTPMPTVRTAPTVNVQPTPAPTITPTPNIDDPNEIIRIETEEVNLNVRVVDRNNRPINGLRQNEFKVYEDNVPQDITSFTTAEVPTNYSLVIDNSGSLRGQLDKVIEAGKIIVNTNRPDDETSVIRFVSSDKIEITQDFTSSRVDLTDALDNLFIEGGPTAIIDAVYLAAEKVDTYEKSRNPTEKKRRALILVSDGEDRDSYYKEAQLFNLLREADVQIYTVGFTNDLDKGGGFISKSPRDKAVNLLKRLAEETGGKSYFPNSVSELNGIANDIAAELRTQYLVSYSPSKDESRQQGAFHNIKVVVNDGAGNQKRIAITRTGRTDTPDASNKSAIPKLQGRPKAQ